jgi:hypothetical protein
MIQINIYLFYFIKIINNNFFLLNKQKTFLSFIIEIFSYTIAV